MPHPETAVKAAESLADWSKWLVTLQTALIAAAPYLLGMRDDALHLEKLDCLLKAALCCFFVSVAAGTVVLGNIPMVLTTIANTPTASVDIHNESASPFGWLGARVWMFAGLEHTFFLAGALMIVIHLWCRG